MNKKRIRLTLKTQRKKNCSKFPRIKRRVNKNGGNSQFLWKYLDSREIYTYHAGLTTGKDKGESAEYWLDLMLSYVSPGVLTALDQLEIDW